MAIGELRTSFLGQLAQVDGPKVEPQPARLNAGCLKDLLQEIVQT